MDESREEPAVQGAKRRRRLRAVLAADIANFGGLVSVDETKTLDALWIARRVAKEELERHGGWLFGMPGDGVFALFESAIDAVRCALNIQLRLSSMPKLDALKMRIGVHMGEVLFQDDLPFGESLVIAARLESLAEPGGVLVSAAVMDAVSSRISATFSEMGVRSLKHSPRRIATFSVTATPGGPGLDVTTGGEPLDHTVMTLHPERAAHAPGREPPEATAPEPAPAVVQDTVSVPEAAVQDAATAEPVAEDAATAAHEPPGPPAAEPEAEHAHEAGPAEHPEEEPAAVDPLQAVLKNLAIVLHVDEPEHAGPSEPGPSAEPVHEPEAGTPRFRRSILDASLIAPLPKAAPFTLPEHEQAAPADSHVPAPDAPSTPPQSEESAAVGGPAPETTPGAAPHEEHHFFGEPVTQAGLAEIARVLTTHVGPVAKLLVRRHATEVSSTSKLIKLLAQEIPAETERHDFVRHAHEALSALSEM